MILVDQDILDFMKRGDIEIDPYERKRLGSNSYDLTLGHKILKYDGDMVLDCKQESIGYEEITIDPVVGLLMVPGALYLGSTNERTFARNTVPCIEGKSSVGRLGISIHATAGFGDVGFNGTWTLEMSCIVPVIIYPNMPIAQVYFHMTMGKCQNPYNSKTDAKYSNQIAEPVPSAMWKNFI